MKESFDFFGFEPTGELKTLAKEIFWKIEMNAPNYARSSAVVEKLRNGYHGVVEIVSRIGDFKVEADAADPSELILRLYRKIHGELMDWKKSRNHALGTA